MGGIACLVGPGLEMHGFSRADANQDAQNFYAGRTLSHGRIEAIPTLFNRGHVEGCSVRDGLKKIGIVGVVIGSGNGGMLARK